MSPSIEESVDIKGLRRLYNRDTRAQSLLDYVATRKYNSVETTVDRLESVMSGKESNCSRRNLVAILRELEQLNCGEFVIGRRGQPSRFRWAVEMISVGRAAKGEDSGVQLLKAEEAKPEESDESELPAGSMRHVFNLRPDYAVVFELPTDFNSREANRLAEFVKTLPFSDPDDNGS
jgi:hypothetical protein